MQSATCDFHGGSLKGGGRCYATTAAPATSAAVQCACPADLQFAKRGCAPQFVSKRSIVTISIDISRAVFSLDCVVQEDCGELSCAGIDSGGAGGVSESVEAKPDAPRGPAGAFGLISSLASVALSTAGLVRRNRPPTAAAASRACLRPPQPRIVRILLSKIPLRTVRLRDRGSRGRVESELQILAVNPDVQPIAFCGALSLEAIRLFVAEPKTRKALFFAFCANILSGPGLPPLIRAKPPRPAVLERQPPKRESAVPAPTLAKPAAAGITPPPRAPGLRVSRPAEGVGAPGPAETSAAAGSAAAGCDAARLSLRRPPRPPDAPLRTPRPPAVARKRDAATPPTGAPSGESTPLGAAPGCSGGGTQGDDDELAPSRPPTSDGGGIQTVRQVAARTVAAARLGVGAVSVQVRRGERVLEGPFERARRMTRQASWAGASHHAPSAAASNCASDTGSRSFTAAIMYKYLPTAPAQPMESAAPPTESGAPPPTVLTAGPFQAHAHGENAILGSMTAGAASVTGETVAAFDDGVSECVHPGGEAEARAACAAAPVEATIPGDLD